MIFFVRYRVNIDYRAIAYYQFTACQQLPFDNRQRESTSQNWKLISSCDATKATNRLQVSFNLGKQAK